MTQSGLQLSADRNSEIESNLGLVHACARKYLGRGIEYDDLYSAGCVGLIKAVDNFDRSRGLRLSTYAVPVILGEIKRLFRDGGAVKVSRSLKELSIKATRLNAEYIAATGEEPTISRLAEMLGVSVHTAAEALDAARLPLSLTAVTDSGDEQLDVPVESSEQRLTEHMSLLSAIEELEPADRELIQLRYFSHKTQRETAQRLNTTQVQISRREKKLLAAIREKMTV